MGLSREQARCLCGQRDWQEVFTYAAPPEGEVRFSTLPSQGYRRQVVRCRLCGHFLSCTDLDLSQLYQKDYVDSTYGQGLTASFARIMALPPERSDNRGRVANLLALLAARGLPTGRLLDVGSGLAVFPALMAQAGWDCTPLDPDPRFVEHARQAAGLDGVCADFMRAADMGPYELISFNKVLEHVEEPVAMLARARNFLTEKGLVYLELPDGQAAAHDGPGREEFFIEHHHVFSAASLALLAERAGFSLLLMERLREPSGKYTLRGLANAGGGQA